MFAQNENLWWQNEWLQITLILGTALLIAIIIKFITISILSRLSRIEKLHIDVTNKKSIGNIVFWITIITGIYFALGILTIFQNYLLYRDLIYFLIIAYLIGKIIAQLLKFAFDKFLSSNDVYKSSSKTVLNIVNFIIYSIVVLIVLSRLNIDITPLVAALGISGIAIGLAVQAPLANFFAGLFILSSNPLRTGEFIEMDGNISGYVEEIGWFSTKIRSLGNTLIIIPNSKITSTTVMNQTRIGTEKWVGVTIGVNPNEDLDKVERIASNAAMKVRDENHECIKDIAPIVRYQSIGDFTINLKILVKVQKIDYQLKITHELIKAVMKEMNAQKIDLPPPIRRVELIK